jgi:hypothetical protein
VAIHALAHEPLGRQDQPDGGENEHDELPAVEPLAATPVGKVAKDNHADEGRAEGRQVEDFPDVLLGLIAGRVDVEERRLYKVGGEEAVGGREKADGDGAKDGPVEADRVEDAEDGGFPLVPVL